MPDDICLTKRDLRGKTVSINLPSDVYRTSASPLTHISSAFGVNSVDAP